MSKTRFFRLSDLSLALGFDEVNRNFANRNDSGLSGDLEEPPIVRGRQLPSKQPQVGAESTVIGPTGGF